jgi:energy-coupling factor transport system substrate-specific component
MATTAQEITSSPAQQRDYPLFLLMLLLNLIGLAAFLLPFLDNSLAQSPDEMTNRGGESLLLVVVLSSACLMVILAQMGSTLNTKTIALLGVLLAINSVLRLMDVIVPLPGGFSPVFVLIILVGYVYGSQLGFLLGTLTLLASSLFIGGLGPWLPFQMFAAGWVGMVAGWLPHVAERPRIEIGMLVVYGVLSGIIYGFVLNLYFWPFFAGAAEQSWQPGLDPLQGLSRYLVFYGITSAWWDFFRAVGNVVLLVALGPALLRALRRFQKRFFPEIAQEAASAS